MLPVERKTTFSLAAIYAFRMLGLFMILPIFSLYTHRLGAATPSLMGIALGAYGLTQAIFQIPFGMISDRIGRKPVIFFGLILFIIGSVIAALSHTIYGIILGRIIQGAGAIGSTLIALLADVTAEENRLKAMSIIGMTIGFSFALAMIVGPIVDGLVGLTGIFWLTAILACIGILILLILVPTPKTHRLHRDSEPVLSQFKNTLKTTELLRLNFGIFSLHAVLMALFLVMPIVIVSTTGFPENKQWLVYVPVLVLACVAMLPFIIIAEARRLMKPVFVGAILALMLTQIALWFWHADVIVIALLLFVFFTAFTILEGILPSLVSKIATAGSKGTAMGIYSASQFLGVFFGGTMGGLIANHFGAKGTFLFCAIMSLLWLFCALTMKKPLHLSSKMIVIMPVKSPEEARHLEQALLATPGVKEAMVSADEGVAYLKIDKREFSEASLKSHG